MEPAEVPGAGGLVIGMFSDPEGNVIGVAKEGTMGGGAVRLDRSRLSRVDETFGLITRGVVYRAVHVLSSHTSTPGTFRGRHGCLHSCYRLV